MYIESRLITSEKQLEDGRTEVVLLDEESKTELKRKYSTELLEFIKTEKPIDPTAFRKLEASQVVKEMLTVLERFKPRVSNVQYILQSVSNAIQMHMERSDDLIYGVPLDERTLDMYHDVLIAHDTAESEKDIPQGK